MAISLTIMSIDFDSFEAPVTKTFNKNEISIGRKENNDLVLDRQEVSAYHAKISVKKNGVDNELHLFVKDLGSSSGTMLERDPLVADTEIKIDSNQRLIIGSYLIKPNIVEDTIPEPELLGIDQLSASANTQNLIIKEENDYSGYIKPTSQQEQSAPSLKTEIEEIHPISLAEQIEISSDSSTKDTVIEAMPSQYISPVTQNDTGIQEILSNTTNNFVSIAATEEKSSASNNYSAAAVVESTPAIAKIILENSNILDINFTALQLVSLKGRVLHKNSGLAAVLVDAGNLGKMYTNENGCFEFQNIEEGTSYELKVSKDKFIFDTSTASKVIDSDLDFTINAKQLFNIGGKIIHKGKPIAGVEIECVNVGKTTTDANGAYSFEDVAEGQEYLIKANKAGFVFKQTRMN